MYFSFNSVQQLIFGSKSLPSKEAEDITPNFIHILINSANSTGTGFILSYLITTKLGKIIQTSQGLVLEFKEEAKYVESPDYKEALNNTNHSYDNTLIERDIKDPSPTINASFRVIGRTERSSFNYKSSNNDEAEYEGAFEFDDDLDEQFVKNETINQPNSIMSDWDDETYSAW